MREYFENGHFPMRKSELRKGFPDLSEATFEYLVDESSYAGFEIIDGLVYSLTCGDERQYKENVVAQTY